MAFAAHTSADATGCVDINSCTDPFKGFKMPAATGDSSFFANGGLDGPVVDNAIPGWGTIAATVSIVDKDGRTEVLMIEDAGKFSRF